MNNKQAFIRNMVQAAGIKIVKVRSPLKRGMYGFTRLVGDTLERSSRCWRNEDEAFAAAHKHYNLRSA